MDEVPTPEEVVRLAEADFREAIARRQNATARRFDAFVAGLAAHLTPKGDPATNVIDQGARRTYNLPPDGVRELLARLEECRKSDVHTHFSERQGRPGRVYSGLMLDYDIVTARGDAALDERGGYRIVHAVACELGRVVALGEGDVQTAATFITKPAPKALPAPPGAGGRRYKYGFHLLFPGVQLERNTKKFILRRLREARPIVAVMHDLGVVEKPEECLDPNSASVPVLFLGSSKRGGDVYSLGKTYEVNFEAYDHTAPIVRVLGDAELAPYSMVHELSLNSEASYADAPPLIQKRRYDPKAEFLTEITSFGARAQNGIVPESQLLFAEHKLMELTRSDPQAKYLYQLLSLLPAQYARDRALWRAVVFALADVGPNYLPLAEWFSQKCPEKWAAGGAAALDTLWADAVKRADSVGAEARVTKRSIVHWARAANPERFRAIEHSNYFSILAHYAYRFHGKLEHYMIAKILSVMLEGRYVTDAAPGSAARAGYAWYEFVMPGQSMKRGEVWKWREEREPDELQLYMSEQMNHSFDDLSAYIEDQRRAAEDANAVKYYTLLARNIEDSRRKLFNDTFKSGVIRQASILFRERGFSESLDQDPCLFGVGNGILKLGARAALVNHFHEHRVMQHTPVPYQPFDATDPWVRLVLKAFKDMFPEVDMRNWYLFHMATALSGDIKDVLLFDVGGGNNGKTFRTLLWKNTIGPMYGSKIALKLLTGETEDADKPNSAAMRLKLRRCGYFEESNKSMTINAARLKDLVATGEFTARDLNKIQETFIVMATLIVNSNFDLMINTRDHGTWKRAMYYSSKIKFCARPDPDNPFERQEDSRFLREYAASPDCQRAMLSILVYYYERLQREFGGKIKNIPCPTLEGETRDFRNRQDTINRFISEMIVTVDGTVAAVPAAAYALSDVADKYSTWFDAHIEPHRHSPSEIIREFENSALHKHLVRRGNCQLALEGCRVLPSPSAPLQEGEEYVNAARGDSLTERGCPNPFVEKDDWWAPTGAVMQAPAITPSAPVPAMVFAAPAGADECEADNLAPVDDQLFVEMAARRPAPRPPAAHVAPEFFGALIAAAAAEASADEIAAMLAPGGDT